MTKRRSAHASVSGNRQPERAHMRVGRFARHDGDAEARGDVAARRIDRRYLDAVANV